MLIGELVTLSIELSNPGSGVATGVVALAFIRSLAKTEDLFDAIPIPGYLKAGLGGLHESKSLLVVM